MRDTDREAETQAEGEWEPDVGLDPQTPGSRPEPDRRSTAEPPKCPPRKQFRSVMEEHFPSRMWKLTWVRGHNESITFMDLWC